MSDQALPILFKQRMELIIPEESFTKCWESFHEPKKVCFRINTLVQPDSSHVVDSLSDAGFSLSEIPWQANTFTVPPEQRSSLVESDAFSNAEIYIQNPSSALAVYFLDPQPGETILDLTAAPGGKTILIAQRMKNEGTLAAVESVRNRFFRLKANLVKNGVHNSRCYLADGRAIQRKTPERFDRVLLDAPCSGESRFHVSDPASWQYWSKKKISESARKQKGLLRSAFNCLKPGGTLVYCTCSFAPEENEAIVGSLLKKFSDQLTLCKIQSPVSNGQRGITTFENLKLTDELNRCLRVLPNQTYDGFFIALIQKNSRGES